jgi:NRPS condensation-like uncharacterized protein
MDYTAEIFDQFQELCDINRFNDHELHCVLRFEEGPDTEVLKKAVLASIEAIPILGTRYIGGAEPRWTSLEPADFDRAFARGQTETAFEAFLVSHVDEGLGPQVHVFHLDSNPPAVAIKMNHMVCDAAGFKEYLYFLCGIYSELRADPAFRPTTITGDRSIRPVLERFGVWAQLRSLLFQGKENNLTGGDRFPQSEVGEAQPFILTRKLGRKTTAALRDYGRARGATLNDIVLTGYYRCLFQRLAPRPGSKLQIPVMVDMRRYLPKSETCVALTNLTSTVVTGLEYRPEQSFEDTLGEVKAIMDEKKGGDIGLNSFIKLNLIYRTLGDRIARRLLRSVLNNPLICMTNVGILDPTRLSFGDLRPNDAFLCGSIKYRPYFQLAMSSYEGEITLSVNLVGSADDRNSILSFFDEIAAELPA